MKMPEPKTLGTDGEALLARAPVEDVFAATEEVRAADFPNVPAQLLVGVLAAERDNPDNRAAAARAVGRAVDEYLIGNPTAATDAADGGTSA